MRRRMSAAGALLSAAILLCHATSQARSQPAAGAPAPAPAKAPANLGPPNPIQGFSKNRDKPVQIEATTLEVRDKDKMATFTGNVHVIQGDTDMRCRVLVVYYEDSADMKSSVSSAQSGPGDTSQIKRLEATGNVIITQEDQTATGDKGVFDMHTNIVTLTGNVVVSQGQNVVRGARLVVDMTTGVSHVEGGRVQGIFQRSGNDAESANSSTPAAH